MSAEEATQTPDYLEIGKYMLECRLKSHRAEATAEVVMGAG